MHKFHKLTNWLRNNQRLQFFDNCYSLRVAQRPGMSEGVHLYKSMYLKHCDISTNDVHNLMYYDIHNTNNNNNNNSVIV